MNSFMQLQQLCSICPDYRNAQSKLNNIIRINDNLSRYIDRNKINYNIRVEYYPTPLHFGCGHCRKFDTMNFNRMEKEIYIKCEMICNKIQENNLSTENYSNILRLVQGYYPQLYNKIQRCWAKQRAKNISSD